MIERFEILESTSERPDAEQILFCDGTGGKWFRDGKDLELSHWRPNRTPVEYRAGTSTDICYRFLDNPKPGSWIVAVNNHVDVDGILSVYVLVHSQHALCHRQTILEAAEMGDFWGWGEQPAQRVFQGITHIMQQTDDPRAIYEEAFRRIPGFIDGGDPAISNIDESLIPLKLGLQLIEQQEITRCVHTARFVQYVIPWKIAGDGDVRASYVPTFNEAISTRAILWPQVRAGWDAERVCLVSVERQAGWFHDLWFPGYLWADTDGKWQVPGFTFYDGMSRYAIRHEGLLAAFERLQQAETGLGTWELGGTACRFGKDLLDQFPVVGRFLDDQGQVAASQLNSVFVATVLADVFAE